MANRPTPDGDARGQLPAAQLAAKAGLTPWGIKEIAAFTGKPEGTVRQWRVYKSRTNPERNWPDPDWPEVGGHPAWAERTVLAHLYRYGISTREPLTPEQRRKTRARLRQWNLLDQEP